MDNDSTGNCVSVVPVSSTIAWTVMLNGLFIESVKESAVSMSVASDRRDVWTTNIAQCWSVVHVGLWHSHLWHLNCIPLPHYYLNECTLKLHLEKRKAKNLVYFCSYNILIKQYVDVYEICEWMPEFVTELNIKKMIRCKDQKKYLYYIKINTLQIYSCKSS